MSEIDMSDPDEQRRTLDELLDLESGLTIWELAFIEGLEQRLHDGGAPSEVQLSKLAQIAEDRLDG